MDNVLTNFSKAALKLGKDVYVGLQDGADPKLEKKAWDAVDAAGEAYWADMEWMPDGQALWDLLTPYHPVLLSSPGSCRFAASGKLQWVSKNIPGTTLICIREKFLYAERDAILIDDMEKNIVAWNDQGGIGILHTNTASTEEKLLDLLWKR